MIILIRHAQSEGNSPFRSLFYVTKELIQARKSRYPPDYSRPPRQTYTRWPEAGTLLMPQSTPFCIPPQADLSRPKKQAKSSVPSSVRQTPSTSIHPHTEEREKQPKESSMLSRLPPQITNPPLSHGTQSKCMKSPDYENRILETSNLTPQR